MSLKKYPIIFNPSTEEVKQLIETNNLFFIDTETTVSKTHLVFNKLLFIQILGLKTADWAGASSYKIFQREPVYIIPVEVAPKEINVILQEFFLSKKYVVFFNASFDIAMILKHLYPRVFYPGVGLFVYSSAFIKTRVLDLSIILRIIHSGYNKNTLNKWYERLYGVSLNKEAFQTSFLSGRLPSTEQQIYMYKDVFVLVRLAFHIYLIRYWWRNSFTKEKVFPLKLYLDFYEPLICETVDFLFRGFNVSLTSLEDFVASSHAAFYKTSLFLSRCLSLDAKKLKSGSSLEEKANPLENWDFTEAQKRAFPKTETGALSFSLKSYKRFVLENPQLEKNKKFSIFLKFLEQKNFKKEVDDFFIKTFKIKGQGKIFSSLNIYAATTARFSTSGYNMQGLPHKPNLKKCIVPHTGNIFVKFDIKQEEVRIMAEISQDAALLDVFKQKKDFHCATAAALAKMPYNAFCAMEKKDKPLYDTFRALAKILNFGLFYGMQAKKLDFQLKNGGVLLPFEEVKKYWSLWRETYPGIVNYQEEMVHLFYESSFNVSPSVFYTYKKDEKNPYSLTSLKGRKKTASYLDIGFITKKHFFKNLKHKSEESLINKAKKKESKKVNILNEASNFPIQATGVDILISLYLMCLKKLKNKARIILTVHDSIILETPKEYFEEVSKTLEEIIEKVGAAHLPLIGLEADFEKKNKSYNL